MSNGYKILIVEDEPLIRLGLSDAIFDAGFDVLEAGTVLEAIAVIGSHRDIDILITDVDMPGGLTGLDLVDVVKRSGWSVPVIVTSGREACDVALHEGITFVPKPYDRMSMVALVRDLIGLRRAGCAMTANWKAVV